MINNAFTIFSFFLIFLILILYFSKKRINTVETNVYSWLVIVNFIMLVFALLTYITISNYESIPIINDIISKTLLVIMFIWIIIFTLYVIYLSVGENRMLKYKNNIFIKICLFILIGIITFLIYYLPLYYYHEPNISYSYGPSANVVYISSGVFIVVWLISIVYNYKNLKSKKYIPLYLLIAIGAVSIVIQKMYPSYLLITSVLSYCVAVMYHTIENPDVKMMEQLNIAKANAEKANKAKTDFLSSMSHEIRTPLNAIVGFSEMIENENTIEGCKENAKDIVLASHTLLEIVNGILDISKIEANKMEIVNKEYRLLPELENLAKLMVPRIEDKPIELKTNFAPDLPDVMYGDIGKIKQVVTNLLTNACKYTERGQINFNVSCINEDGYSSLVIVVEDTGRGIKPEQIDKLFSKFQRLDEDRNTTIEGTGLGLAITKSLTEMMGGRIVVQSAYGEGSKFIVYLRQKIVTEKSDIEEQVKVEENLKFDGKILVVDDNKLNLKVADKLLKTYGLHTVLVESGMECIDLIKQGNTYDIILMDDMMPRLRGPEVLLRLKQIPNFSIPTIALTANATDGLKESYINDGFDDYLAKPIEKPELVRVLKNYLSNTSIEKVETLSENKVEIVKNEILNDIDEPVVIGEEVNVLIVDDNKINIRIASTIMKSYNFNIEEALSGQECLEKVKNKKYDLIFMDYMMPNMDGIETLKHLKELPNFESCAIALTADATDGSREKFLDAGFDEYVAKPIDRKLLDDVINKLLNKKTKETKQEIKEVKEFDKVEFLKSNNIDVDHGIELLGDMEMYNETLNLFMTNLSSNFNKINTYKMNSDMPNYAIEVHALKSDSKYLGFTKLSEIAYDHELKSKDNDLNYVNEHYNELVVETKRIFEICKKYFNV